MGKICVFFGHRFVPEPEKIKQKLKAVVRDLIQEDTDTFWLGGYGDFDHLAEDVVRELKAEFPHIKKVLALAYLPQNKEDYQYKSQFYDDLFYPEGVENGPQKFAITRRNKYMAENADVIVAYVHGTTGGAALALKHAKKLKKIIILIDPETSSG